MAGIAASPFTRCSFEQAHTATGLAGHQGRAQGGIAPTDHQDIDGHAQPAPSIGLDAGACHDVLPDGLFLAHELGVLGRRSAATDRVIGSKALGDCA